MKKTIEIKFQELHQHLSIYGENDLLHIVMPRNIAVRSAIGIITEFVENPVEAYADSVLFKELKRRGYRVQAKQFF